MDELDLLIILIIGCFISSGYFLFWMYVAHHHQIKAYAGNEKSAKRIILPFYQPFIRYCAMFYTFLGIILSLLFVGKNVYFSRVLQFYGFIVLSIYFLLPSFLLQTSASMRAVERTFYQLLPWWFGCSVFWALSFLPDSTIAFIFFASFLIAATTVPIYVSITILFKLTYSRVQIGSKSNRNTTELVLLYSVLFGTYLLLTMVFSSEAGNRANDDSSSDTHHQRQLILDGVFTGLVFIANLLFPFAMFRTFIADTKFWRGLGKHNQGGINQHETLRQSGINVHRPTMELNVISSSFQVMMADINDITVDFAYLQLDQLVGEGATAKVFRGKLKGKLVAIKLSTPPEITEEVLDVFVAESRLASSLTHRHIVQFLGICVRPPQIGMVFEFCEGGNLKSNLAKHPLHWRRQTAKLQACLEASLGIACLHRFGYIHRDIKTENFFVGKKWVVKLGDFGEARRVCREDTVKTKRMTILGTVAFMAPELVNAQRYYDQSIDVYALGITFWEIWTGNDPYENCSQFEIYERVKKGVTLELPDSLPNEIRELIASMWNAEPAKRPSSKQISEFLEKFSKNALPRMQENEGVALEEEEEEDNPLKNNEEEVKADERASQVLNPIVFKTDEQISTHIEI